MVTFQKGVNHMKVKSDILSLSKNTTGIKVPVTIQGVGYYAPKNTITNEELCKTLNTNERWIQRKIGIKERRFISNDQLTSDMSVKASVEAIEQAKINAEDIDVIILTTSTPNQGLPSTALVVKEEIGATKAIPIDLTQTACAGGIYSFVLGAHLLQNDNYNNVLVIGAEAHSRITNNHDRLIRVIFGDGAGAAILQKTKEGYGLLSWDLESSLNYAVEIVGGGVTPKPDNISLEDFHGPRMDGREVYNVATEKVPQSIRSVVDKAGLTLEDLDHFLLHQANINIIKSALEDLHVPMDKTTLTIQDYGNTGSASLFSVLYKALTENRITEGNYFVLSAIGAGFIWGSACFKYTKN